MFLTTFRIEAIGNRTWLYMFSNKKDETLKLKITNKNNYANKINKYMRLVEEKRILLNRQPGQSVVSYVYIK